MYLSDFFRRTRMIKRGDGGVKNQTLLRKNVGCVYLEALKVLLRSKAYACHTVQIKPREFYYLVIPSECLSCCCLGCLGCLGWLATDLFLCMCVCECKCLFILVLSMVSSGLRGLTFSLSKHLSLWNPGQKRWSAWSERHVHCSLPV